ncbi:TPA: hypothetical protein OTP48_003766, partial [Acinetobacter baumannii]|nr:hypothetical protein [Acinetobacter baumannii]HCT2391241.1 hypothetical protein [Acinetobacter baumannii]HCT4527972.1 hypothetical protein [Acinetobacter baumannii]HCU1827912.1 hypothetical protein [Acinetobacter baumannii]HCU1870958.1 hypothetical protein [Acinetobacter baumannii]
SKMRFEKKLIFGVGINDWNTPVRKDGKLIKEYYLWSGVIQRCYSETFQKRQPAYKGVTCSEDWLTLSNFEKDIQGKANFDKCLNERWQLDKDILFKGNKHYSNETTCFVPPAINLLFCKSDSARGDYPIGVTFNKWKGKFQAQLKVNGHNKMCQKFDNAMDAFYWYKNEKEKEIKRVANLYKDQLDSKVYHTLINYEVELTD